MGASREETTTSCSAAFESRVSDGHDVGANGESESFEGAIGTGGQDLGEAGIGGLDRDLHPRNGAVVGVMDYTPYRANNNGPAHRRNEKKQRSRKFPNKDSDAA